MGKDSPFVPEQLECLETIGAKNDPLSRPRLNDLIYDAYGFHVFQSDHTPEVVDCEYGQHHEGGPSANVGDGQNVDSDYIRLKCEAVRPLFHS